MYKLLLVDDEVDVREGLLHEIDWEKHGFKVEGTAENGREAMEMVDRLSPDVVLTDISMPFMDGLALTDWIRREYPATRIVLLSGYDEFEYAQRAIKLDVDEYILKPFEAEQIVQVLHKVKERLDVEIAGREDMEQLRKHYLTSLPVLRETFLISLLSRKMPVSQIVEKARGYELDLEGKRYMVSAISLEQDLDLDLDSASADEEPQVQSSDSKSPGSRAGSLRVSGDIDLQLFAVWNIAEEIWNGYKLGKAIIYQNHVVLLTLSDSEDSAAVLKATLDVLQDIVLQIDRFLKLTVTVGVGEPVKQLTDLKYGYEDALHALDYRVIQSAQRVIYIGDVERRFVNKLRFDELKEHELIRCMKVGSAREMQDVIHSLFDEMAHEGASYKDFQVYVLELLTAVLKAAKDADADMDDIFDGSNVIFVELQKLSSLGAAREWFVALCTKLMQHITSNRQHSYKQLVQQAIDYTKANYGDSELSVNQVCGHLHISAGYFSGIFKKEVKMTFVSYLMNLRMEAAKELLLTTELKSFEIAEKVGFSEPNYFSFCFKKQVGISPKEYRSRSKEG